MSDSLPEILRSKIIARALPGGGFSSSPGGQYRPDASAWAILALRSAGEDDNLLEAARARLAADQLEDGRICLSKNHPQSFWPTALAVLAWHNSPTHGKSRQKGINFLLQTSGKHYPKEDDSPVAHDSSLRGWPWIGDTHSWVEPTCLALLALGVAGKGNHPRAEEARRMLLNRQLETGGWNYGNTAVFGQQLWPMPESTGLALSALGGNTERESVGKSLSYLKREMSRLETPLSLGWGCLGLSAWGERPEVQQDALLKSLRRQEICGPHTTEELSVLLIALNEKDGFRP
jgi:hypothetical protein